MYYILNKFFFVFHSTWIIFNLFGWMWKKTRLANLITLSLTAFSWFILGIWYGYGFCPSTEWHWQVRIKLGIYDMPSSYLKFLIDSMTGLNISEGAVNIFAFVFLILAFSVSIMINIKDWKKKHK